MIHRIALLTLFLLPYASLAANDKYRFADFPATTQLYDEAHAPLLDSVPLKRSIRGFPVPDGPLKPPPPFTRFRTAIGEAVKQGVNFAGAYVLAYWGCGTGCQGWVIVDGKTGAVYGYIYSELGLEYRADSRLLIFNPNPDNESDSLFPATTYWEWDGNKLKQLP